MRAVLITIADASNRDGQHAQPGMQAMIEGSLYSEGHVQRTITKLQDEGWLEETSPRAPGRSAEYRVPMDNDQQTRSRARTMRGQERAPCAVKDGHERAMTAQRARTQMRGHSEPVPLIGFTDTVCTEVSEVSDPLKSHARLLAVLAFEQPVKPVTRGGFPAVMARIKAELGAGTDPQRIEQAIKAGDITWTADGFRMAISRVRSSSERTINNPEVPYDPDREMA